MSVVGTLWSAVATVRSGRRTVRPASRNPSKAWGDVTSWIEVQVDEEQVGLAVGRVDDVGVPDLLAERAWRHQRVDCDDVDLEHATRCPVLDRVARAPRPTSTWPSGELGEITGRSPWRSSMEPTKNRWVSSSSSPS